MDEPSDEAPQEELSLLGEAIPLLANPRVLLLERRMQLRHQ